MVTVMVTHQTPEGGFPSGSIILDTLLRKYLVKIGLKRFKTFSVEEIKGYALRALRLAVEKYGLEGNGANEFWEWMQLGGRYSQVRLLPDTAEGRAYHAEQAARREKGDEGEETLILCTVANVKTLIRKVFVNEILQNLRVDARRKQAEDAAIKESAPTTRRGRPSDEQQPLDEILRHFREESQRAEVEAARFILNRVRGRFDAQQLRIIDLQYDDDYTPREVAAALEIDVKTVYKVNRAHTRECMKLWERIFSPG